MFAAKPQRLLAEWQNGRMAERVLPDTKQLAEPPKHLAKFLLKVDLDSLGQGASPGLKKLSKKVLKVTATTIGKSVTNWDKLFKTLKYKKSLHKLVHGIPVCQATC